MASAREAKKGCHRVGQTRAAVLVLLVLRPVAQLVGGVQDADAVFLPHGDVVEHLGYGAQGHPGLGGHVLHGGGGGRFSGHGMLLLCSLKENGADGVERFIYFMKRKAPKGRSAHCAPAVTLIIAVLP